jgi:hypothetical protein
MYELMRNAALARFSFSALETRQSFLSVKVWERQARWLEKRRREQETYLDFLAQNFNESKDVSNVIRSEIGIKVDVDEDMVNGEEMGVWIQVDLELLGNRSEVQFVCLMQLIKLLEV